MNNDLALEIRISQQNFKKLRELRQGDKVVIKGGANCDSRGSVTLTVEDNFRDMTVGQIEKALGYRINIVEE